MKLSRLLPPLLLVGALGLITWRAMRQPRRDEMRIAIRVHWEDQASWPKLVTDIQRYQEQYRTPDDLAFASHALLRAREPEKALRARWPDLEREIAPAELKAFAEEALLAIGWADEALTKPSAANLQAAMALIEGGNSRVRAWLTEELRTQPLEAVFRQMQQSLGYHEASTRSLVSTACRGRAAAEVAAGRSPIEWHHMAAVLETRSAPYPEWPEDRALLLELLEGTWRTERAPRWQLVCRALGRSGDTAARDALRAMAARLEGLGGPLDARDLGIVRVSLLAGGDWDLDAYLRGVLDRPAGTSDTQALMLRRYYLEALLHRWRTGDPRARAPLDAAWDGIGAQNPSAREHLARAQLLGPEMPGPEVPVEHMLQRLEAPGTMDTLEVVALAFRVRRGDPGARMRLVAWLARERMGDPEQIVGNAQQALNPTLSGLRALYLY